MDDDNVCWSETDWEAMDDLCSQLSAGRLNLTRSARQAMNEMFGHMQDANPVFVPRDLPPGVWTFGGHASQCSGSGEGGPSGNVGRGPLKHIAMVIVVFMYIDWSEKCIRNGVLVPFGASFLDVGFTSPPSYTEHIHTHTHTHTHKHTHTHTHTRDENGQGVDRLSADMSCDMQQCSRLIIDLLYRQWISTLAHPHPHTYIHLHWLGVGRDSGCLS
jgi:ABC-type nickel/cobalt efflux system permease component RcnA